MCARSHQSCDSLYVLSGVAVRLARRQGLHRDGASLGLSPFETEMRRRLWWQIAQVDYRTASVLGTRPSLDLAQSDAKHPLNVNDEDLDPEMTCLPPERNGITSIALCLIRCKGLESLKMLNVTNLDDVRWESLQNPDITLSKKDRVINQMEDELEMTYLRHIDPSNSLHLFVSIMIRSSICKMKLMAHNPRQFAKNGADVPESERNIVYENATKLLEYIALMHSGGHGLQRFSWQIGTSFLWHVILYSLLATRGRAGPQLERLWELIGAVLVIHPGMFVDSRHTVYAVLGRWVLEVWDGNVKAAIEQGLPQPMEPNFIGDIRRCRASEKEGNQRDVEAVTHSASTHKNTAGFNKSQPQLYDASLTDFETIENYGFPNLGSFEGDENEWLSWDQLVDQSSIAPADHMYQF